MSCLGHLQNWMLETLTEIENVKKLNNFQFYGPNQIGQNIFENINLSCLGQRIYLEFIDSSYMLSLPSQDRSKHNTSKIEMLVCQFLLNLHSFDCGKEFFKSVVCNDGSQQKIADSRFSLDAFCQKCGTGYLIEGGFKSSCPKHAHLVNNNIKSGCITIGMVKSDL